MSALHDPLEVARELFGDNPAIIDQGGVGGSCPVPDRCCRAWPGNRPRLYYQAEVAAAPGIDKIEKGYSKVQRQVLALRRAGRMPCGHIADATRWMRKPTSYDGIEDALAETARLYRRNVWRDAEDYVETGWRRTPSPAWSTP